MLTKYNILEVLLLLVFFETISFVNCKAQSSTSEIKMNQWNLDTSIKIKQEIISKRNRNSKQFELENGQIRLYTTVGSLHYLEDSKWKEISTNISKNHSTYYPTHPYAALENNFKTFYPSNILKNDVITLSNEGTIKEKLLSLFVVDKSGKKIFSFPINLNSKISSDGSSITYKDVFQDIDVKYTNHSDTRKLELILKTNKILDRVPKLGANIIIEEAIEFPQDWVIEPNENGINVRFGLKNIILIPQPNGACTTKFSDNYLSTFDGSISFEKDRHQKILYSKFSIDSIKSRSEYFPIKLDPSIIFHPDSILNWTGYENSGVKHSGDLKMNGTNVAWAKFDISGFPVGAEITNGYYSGLVTYANSWSQMGVIFGGTTNFDPVIDINISISLYLPYSNCGSCSNFGSQYNVSSLLPLPIYLDSTGRSIIAIEDLQQGWTAVLFRNPSISSTVIHAGYESSIKPALILDYTLSACSGLPNLGQTKLRSSAGRINTSPAYVCPNSPFTLFNKIVLGTGLEYQWYKNTLPIPSATDRTYIAAVNPTDTFNCIVTCPYSGLSDTTNNLIAIATSSLHSDSTTSIHSCDPNFIYNWNGNNYSMTTHIFDTVFTLNAEGCDSLVTLHLYKLDFPFNDTVVFNGVTVESLDSNAGTAYQWFDVSTLNAIPGATNRIFLPNYSGKFEVQLTRSYCQIMSNWALVTMVGFDELNGSQSPIIYPNPTNSDIHLNLREESRITLFDAVGNSLLTLKLESGKHLVKLNDLPNGLYFLQTISSHTSSITRVIKN